MEMEMFRRWIQSLIGTDSMWSPCLNPKDQGETGREEIKEKLQHFVAIQEIKILFHNVYKETLLIFRSKKLNIGKVFLLFLFLIK